MKEPCLTAKMLCIVFVFCAATAIASRAQVFTTLHSFAGPPNDGANPFAGLLQASDGDFYGTTYWGGGYGYGTIFGMYPTGTLTTLLSFGGSNGANPNAALTQAFYGTTYDGGAYGYGTVFGGSGLPLYSFCSQANCTDGAYPYAGLVQASDGNFYGTTSSGGISRNCIGHGCGTIFKITPNGSLTVLHSFDGNDSELPGGLIQASDGNFYGTTAGHGGGSDGTVFKITPDGTLTTLHYFNGGDGDGPEAALVQASDGNFSGTTYSGGAYDNCFLFCGTVFRITPSGSLTVLHSFNGTDGAAPSAALIQASDGNFYGTTYYGGASGDCSGGCGTIFKITPNGTLTTLHSFGGTDGAGPYGGLIQASDGNFYGTTAYGGANGYGTVFRLVSVRPCIVCPAVE